MAIVTVGIPTYNRSAYLRESMSSVLGQSFGDFNLLISDNGSTDDTEDVVREFARVDKRVVYHRFPQNGGLARNLGHVLMTPDTELVAFLPDDDLLLPHHLASAVEALQSVPNAVLYGCTAEFFEEKPGYDFHEPYWVNGKKSRLAIDSTKRIAPWLKETPMAPASVVFRRSARQQITWRNDDSFGAMDWLFWGQIALCGVTIFDPVVGVRYRWHKGNQSHNLLKGRRSVVQSRYVMRQLATLALNRGGLSVTELVDEVLRSWPLSSAATFVVALAAFDTHPVLRKAALEIFHQKSELGTSRESSKHCRLANRIGTWYLGAADVVDRLIGRWWPPS